MGRRVRDAQNRAPPQLLVISEPEIGNDGIVVGAVCFGIAVIDAIAVANVRVRHGG